MKYFTKLSMQEVLDFLNENGLYVIDDDLEENLIDCSENNDPSCYIRCFDTKVINNPIMDAIAKKIAHQTGLNLSEYVDNQKINIIELNDFVCCRVFIEDEFSERDVILLRAYWKMMSDKFKNEPYKQDLEEYLNTNTPDM